MPIYEYHCHSCHKEFEVMQKITDPPLTHCKYCNGTVSKLISNSTFHLKGGGWYVTDYGGKKAPNAKGRNPEKKETTNSENTDSGQTKESKTERVKKDTVAA